MPIGLLIGWLIGQLIICQILAGKNGTRRGHDQDSVWLIKQLTVNVCTFLSWTAAGGLVGTIIELLVR